MNLIKGGVTASRGFLANGLSCGIKRSGKPDLSLIYSPDPCVAAGVFTKNSIKAAPLIVSQEHLRKQKARAIIANSGNANCFTGQFGFIYAKRTCQLIADLLHLKPQEVIVASTGIIGKPLPFQKIADAAGQLVKGLTPKGGQLAARGIMTTDMALKEAAVRISLGGHTVTLGACAKGSGMIAPDMATMLAFVTTDAAIDAKLLKQALREAVEESFNRITVDGCMSTNDMVVVLANGRAGNRPIRSKGKEFQKFGEALKFICLDLAKKIVLDGEGATKFIEIKVSGAASVAQAKKVGLAVANSVLVKTAAYGNNPNWGRVAAAVGSAGLNVTEKDLKIKFSSFIQHDICITIGLNLGPHQATIYTSDLSHDYVRINTEYT